MDLRPDDLLVDLRPEDLLVDLRADDLLDDFRAVDLRPEDALDDFRAVDFDDDFRALDLGDDLLAEDFDDLLDLRPDDFRGEAEDLVSPASARSLFTVRAAISFARPFDIPRSSALSFMCSYWRSRLLLQLRCGIGRPPLVRASLRTRLTRRSGT